MRSYAIAPAIATTAVPSHADPAGPCRPDPTRLPDGVRAAVRLPDPARRVRPLPGHRVVAPRHPAGRVSGLWSAPRLLEARRPARPGRPGARRVALLGAVRRGAAGARPVARDAALRVPARLGRHDLLLGRDPLCGPRAARKPDGPGPPRRRAAHLHYRRR